MNAFLERVMAARQSEQMADAAVPLTDRRCACGGVIKCDQPLAVTECFNCRKPMYWREQATKRKLTG